MRPKSTLVPLTDDAVAHTVHFAQRLLGEELGAVTVLRTYLDLMSVDPVLPRVMATPALHDAVAVQAHVQADAVQRELADAAERVGIMVSYGTMAGEVERVTAANAFSWVVVGTGEDDSSFKEGAGAVVTASHAPVLVVPTGARFRPVRRILVADDDGDTSLASMLPLLDIARRTGAEVVLLRVLPPGEADTMVNGSRSHHALLNGIPHSFVTVHSDDVAQAVSEQYQRSDAQLIVLLHRHRGLLGTIFHHSLAKEMANDTAVPLIVLEQ